MSSVPHDQSLPRRLKSWFWGWTPVCREVARLTSLAYDHPLPVETRLRLGLHRCFCRWCARYASQLELLREATERLPDHIEQVNGPTLESGARERMKKALREAGRSTDADG